MRLNASVWYTEFDDLQVQVLNPQGNFAVTNVAGAESYGVEVDGDYVVNDYLTLSASVQWLDATYADDVGRPDHTDSGRRRITALCFRLDWNTGLRIRRPAR